MLLKITFGFPKVKWLHLTGEVDKCVRYSGQILSRFTHTHTHLTALFPGLPG